MSQDSQTNTDRQFDLDSGEDSRYLIFKLGADLYGTPLLGVREVIQPSIPKPIPNTAPHFKGLINLRGQIIGVVDLRARFAYDAHDEKTQAYLLFETEAGPTAAIVDKVESVIFVDKDKLQKKPNIRTQVPNEYLIGAISHKEHLIVLIDLNKTLSKEDYVEIQKAKMGAAS